MGSPIETWENATAIFTGAGGISPLIILLLAVVVCFGAIAYGGMKEEQSYKKHD